MRKPRGATNTPRPSYFCLPRFGSTTTAGACIHLGVLTHMDTSILRPDPPPRKTVVPFAALPHHIAADPRLSPVDVRVLLALLFFAKDKPDCWPSDGSIASRIYKSVATVQRSLRRLETLGLVERRPTAENATGRLLALLFHQRSTPSSSVMPGGRSPVREELEKEEGKKSPD